MFDAEKPECGPQAPVCFVCPAVRGYVRPHGLDKTAEVKVSHCIWLVKGRWLVSPSACEGLLGVSDGCGDLCQPLICQPVRDGSSAPSPQPVLPLDRVDQILMGTWHS